jgi:hypothetical protein
VAPSTLSSFHLFPHSYVEPSTRLSLERAREYDRVSEWLARNRVPAKSSDCTLDSKIEKLRPCSSEVEYGIEGRRAQFDKNSYRQPVLTQRPLKPKNYRRGQPDEEAEKVRNRLRELQDYDLMEDSGVGNAPKFNRDYLGAQETCPEGSNVPPTLETL